MNRYSSFDYCNPTSRISKIERYVLHKLYLIYVATTNYLYNKIDIRNIAKWRKQLKEADSAFLIQSCLLIAMDVLNFFIVGALLFYSVKII